VGATGLEALVVIQREEDEGLAGGMALVEELLQLLVIHVLHALGHLRGDEVQIRVRLVLHVRQVLVVKAQDLVVQPVGSMEQLDIGHPQAGVVEGQRDGVRLRVAAHLAVVVVVKPRTPRIRILVLVLACMLPKTEEKRSTGY